MKAQILFNQIKLISILSLTLLISSCGNNLEKSESRLSKSVYASSLDSRMKHFSKEEISIRDSIFNSLKSNQVYQELVNKKNRDSQYLFLLETLGYGCLSSSGTGFSLRPEYLEGVLSDEENKQFVLKNIMLYIRGGIPEEVYNVIESFKNTYGITGAKGDTYYFNDDEIVLDKRFSLALINVILNPKDKLSLDKFYENKTVANWDYQIEQSITPQFTNWIKFNEYLGQVYPDSKYYKEYSILISAVSLFDEYEANELKADSEYNGKRIAVQGSVENIGRDIMGHPYVSLRTNGIIGSVQGLFDQDEGLAEIQKGQILTIIGTCEGKMMNVLLKECDIW